MRRTAIGMLAAIGMLLAVGCSSGVDKNEVIAELEKDGLSNEQATCLVNAAEDAGIPLDDLAEENYEPTGDQAVKFAEASMKCLGMGDLEGMLEDLDQ